MKSMKNPIPFLLIAAQLFMGSFFLACAAPPDTRPIWNIIINNKLSSFGDEDKLKTFVIQRINSYSSEISRYQKLANNPFNILGRNDAKTSAKAAMEDKAKLESSSYEMAGYISSCDLCSGNKYIPCLECRGTKHLVCRMCRGTGKVPGKVPSMWNWWNTTCVGCNGWAITTCRHCNLGIVACTKCGGTGVRSHPLERKFVKDLLARK